MHQSRTTFSIQVSIYDEILQLSRMVLLLLLSSQFNGFEFSCWIFAAHKVCFRMYSTSHLRRQNSSLSQQQKPSKTFSIIVQAASLFLHLCICVSFFALTNQNCESYSLFFLLHHLYLIVILCRMVPTDTSPD